MWWIVMGGVVSFGLYLGSLAIGEWVTGWPRLASILGGLIVAYLASIWGARNLTGGSPWESRGAIPGEGRLLLAVWGFAVLFRFVIFLTVPTLSDDMFRYLWDGQVFLSGINPYRYAPDAPELQGVIDAPATGMLINNPSLPTIYPPLLMLVFAGAAWIAPTVSVWKALCVLFELAAAWFLMRGLRNTGRSGVWIILWLWHPLVVVEFAGSGHADAVGILLVALALWFWTRSRWMGCGIALVLAGLVKFLPWAALPALIPRLRWRWFLLLLIPVLFYLPFQMGGVNALGSLGVFASRWRANDFLFAFLPGGDQPTETALLGAKRLAAVIAGAVWLWALLRQRSLPGVYAWSLGAILLVSPVVHPWYVVWLLPAALFVWHPAWWVWSITVFLAYAPLPGFLADGVWRESMAIKLLEYVPVLLLVLLQARRERRSGEALKPDGPGLRPIR